MMLTTLVCAVCCCSHDTVALCRGNEPPDSGLTKGCKQCVWCAVVAVVVVRSVWNNLPLPCRTCTLLPFPFQLRARTPAFLR